MNEVTLRIGSQLTVMSGNRVAIEAEHAERVLIVDDEADARRLLTLGLMSSGYECVQANSAAEAVEHLAEQDIALMLSDIRMPDVSGIELLAMVRERYPDLAVIMATAADDRHTAVVAMREGAYDYIVKPFNLEEVGFSVRRALEKRRLALEVRAYQESLERKVQERTRELQQKNDELERLILDVIALMAVTLEVRDEYTAHHSYRVAELAVELARYLGLPMIEVEEVRLAALLHDIGKIGIRESVLHKPGKLNTVEMDHIKTHPLVAEQILRPLKHLDGIIPAIKHEHEAYDGSGYPDGLAGEMIPLHARIIAVADAYDALTSDRPYRAALSHTVAISIMRKGAGHIWDPVLVERFEEVMAQLL